MAPLSLGTSRIGSRCLLLCLVSLLAACVRAPGAAPVGAPAPTAPAAPAPSCAREHLLAMASRHLCPSGSSPARLTPEEIDGPEHALDPARGLVIAEAETLSGAAQGQWQHGDARDFPEFGAPAGGFVMWLGGHCNGEAHLTDPPPHTRQGGHAHWLVLKVRLPEGHAGRYRFMMRTSHRLKDGDNDLWAGRVGQQGPIERAGFGPPGEFTWNPGPAAELGPGLHAFYVAGRSACMAVDRLALVKDDPAALAALP